MGDYSDSPTTAMKLDPERATPLEAAQILSLRQDHVAACRAMALESAARVAPAIVAILADNYAKADANIAAFASRRISWGAFVSENQVLVTERRGQLLAAADQMQRTLQEKTAATAADRTPAERALANWTRQQQSLLPGQRVTDCRYDGALLSCTTG